jgi:hypothetical protein
MKTDLWEHGMSSSLNRRPALEPLIEEVSFTKNALVVLLSDGREIRMPLEWSERLRRATPKQRKEWRPIGGGVGIHWPDIDEDIMVDSLLRG